MALNNALQKKITLPKPLMKKGGVVVLSLSDYERMKEDIEMMQSKKLPKDIEKARKDKIFMPLEKILKEHKL